jgi:hypothetical protein
MYKQKLIWYRKVSMTICKKGMENVKKGMEKSGLWWNRQQRCVNPLEKILFCFFVGYIAVFGFRKAYL